MYIKSNAAKFTETRNQMPETLSVFLTTYTSTDYIEMNATCYLSNDEKSGYAIKTDGDLISVFSIPGANQGSNAIKSAIENGATKLDCISDFLKTIYEKFGFVEYNREKWCDEYAPHNWNYERFGRPDIIYMKIP